MARPLPRWAPEALGVAWVMIAGVAVLIPALAHGTSIGPYDLLSTVGLSARSGVTVHSTGTVDQIAFMIPSSVQTWTQVHHAQLPLWNPYNVLGTPLAFNWQSATFGLTSLVGYLVPMHLAYTVGIVLSILIAGTGAYVFGRVLGLSIIACAFTGTIFELSGPFVGWLGWPMAADIAWAGWLFALAILILRGHRRVRHIIGFALVLMFAIYAGHPETLFLMISCLVAFILVFLGLRVRWLKEESTPIVRPLVDLVLAFAAGFALAAPLLLPGLQILHGSLDAQLKGTATGVPVKDLVNVLLQGYDGLPVAGNHWFGGHGIYSYSAAYVGVIGVVLAGMGIVIRRGRPEVIALVIAGLGVSVIGFDVGIGSILDKFPVIGTIGWAYALLPMAFVAAVLAGVGADVLVRSKGERTVLAWSAGGFAAAGLLLALIWVGDRGHLNPTDASIRAHSFVWPAVATVVGLVVIGALVLHSRRRQAVRKTAAGLDASGWGALALLACETAFLLTAGMPLFSSASNIPQPTPAEATLQQVVGSSVVGVGSGSCGPGASLGHAASPGIIPDFNAVYGVHEFVDYDPVLPFAYLKSWRAADGPELPPRSGLRYCPNVTTASLARLYGISYVVEDKGTAGPAGGVFVRSLGDEDLYRIPGASVATLTPLTGNSLPATTATGSSVAVVHPNSRTWHMETHASTPQVLRLRLTNVPGWHATIDGHPLKLLPYAGVMLQARVPPGHHIIVLTYWPGAFTAGLVIAGLAALVLIVAAVVARRQRHRAEQATPSSS